MGPTWSQCPEQNGRRTVKNEKKEETRPQFSVLFPPFPCFSINPFFLLHHHNETTGWRAAGGVMLLSSHGAGAALSSPCMLYCIKLTL
jgi:hypothetical protein